MAVESRREAKESRRIMMEEKESGKTRKSKTRREPKVASELTNSNRGNCGNIRMGLKGGEGIRELQYLDEAKLGDNIRKMVRAETTDGGGRLDEKGK